jgi:hypothetical protein
LKTIFGLWFSQIKVESILQFATFVAPKMRPQELLGTQGGKKTNLEQARITTYAVFWHVLALWTDFVQWFGTNLTLCFLHESLDDSVTPSNNFYNCGCCVFI